MKKLLLTLSLLLFGCSGLEESQSIEEYFKSINYVQEQNNSSINALVLEDNTESTWAEKAFAERCVWYDLERVVDGDTLIVNEDTDRIRVRMIGIDTPESKKEGTAVEDFAVEASNLLKDYLAYSEEVCLVDDREGDAYDTYGRKLSYVFTEAGEDLNADMIRSGYAEAYTRFPMERKAEFEGYEMSAREAKIGKWSKK